MSLGVQGLRWRPVPVWWPVVVVEVAEEEEGWCRHTGGTDTVAGTVDTVGIDAFAGSTLCKTWSASRDNNRDKAKLNLRNTLIKVQVLYKLLSLICVQKETGITCFSTFLIPCCVYKVYPIIKSYQVLCVPSNSI